MTDDRVEGFDETIIATIGNGKTSALIELSVSVYESEKSPTWIDPKGNDIESRIDPRDREEPTE